MIVRRRRLWLGMLAAAVAGVVEAAGLGRGRRPRSPLRAVWLDDREPADPLAGVDLWLLDPLPDPRPEHGDVMRPVAPGLRLGPLPRDRVGGGTAARRN